MIHSFVVYKEVKEWTICIKETSRLFNAKLKLPSNKEKGGVEEDRLAKTQDSGGMCLALWWW